MAEPRESNEPSINLNALGQKARGILTTEALAGRSPSSDAAREGNPGIPPSYTYFMQDVDAKSAKKFDQARTLLEGGSLASVSELEKIGLPEIVNAYLMQHPGFSSKTNFMLFDQNHDGKLTAGEVESRANNPLLSHSNTDKLMAYVLKDYLKKSPSGEIDVSQFREAAERHLNFEEQERRDALKQKDNLAMAERIMKAIPEKKFAELNVDGKEGVTADDLDKIIQGKKFKESPKELQQAIIDLRTHLPEIVRDYKGKDSVVKFSDLEDFALRNSSNKITPTSMAVCDALTRNNNQLWNILTKTEPSEDRLGRESRGLSHEHIRNLLDEGIKDYNLVTVLNYLDKNFDKIKPATSSGGDRLSLSDIEAYPAVAQQERRLEDLARRLDFNANDIFGQKPALTQDELSHLLRKATTDNLAQAAIGFKPDVTRQTLLQDVIDNLAIVSGNDPNHVLNRGMVGHFLNAYAGAQEDRASRIPLDLPATAAATDSMRSSFGEATPTFNRIIAKGQNGAPDQVFELHVDGVWYSHQPGKPPVKSSIQVDPYTRTMSWGGS